MPAFTEKRDKVDDVIDTYGTTAVLNSVSSETYDEDTGWTTNTSAGVSFNCIPYNQFTSFKNYQAFGNLNLGDVNLIVKGTLTITAKDKVTYDGATYTVESVQPLPLGSTALGKIVIMNEEL